MGDLIDWCIYAERNAKAAFEQDGITPVFRHETLTLGLDRLLEGSGFYWRK